MSYTVKEQRADLGAGAIQHDAIARTLRAAAKRTDRKARRSGLSGLGFELASMGLRAVADHQGQQAYDERRALADLDALGLADENVIDYDDDAEPF